MDILQIRGELVKCSVNKATPIGNYVSGPPPTSFIGKCEILEMNGEIRFIKVALKEVRTAAQKQFVTAHMPNELFWGGVKLLVHACTSA